MIVIIIQTCILMRKYLERVEWGYLMRRDDESRIGLAVWIHHIRISDRMKRGSSVTGSFCFGRRLERKQKHQPYEPKGLRWWRPNILAPLFHILSILSHERALIRSSVGRVVWTSLSSSKNSNTYFSSLIALRSLLRSTVAASKVAGHVGKHFSHHRPFGRDKFQPERGHVSIREDVGFPL